MRGRGARISLRKCTGYIRSDWLKNESDISLYHFVNTILGIDQVLFFLRGAEMWPSDTV